MVDLVLQPGVFRPPPAWVNDPSLMDLAVVEADQALRRNRKARAERLVVIAQALDYAAITRSPPTGHLIEALRTAMNLRRERLEPAGHDLRGATNPIRVMEGLLWHHAEQRPITGDVWLATIHALGLAKGGEPMADTRWRLAGLKTPELFDAYMRTVEAAVEAKLAGERMTLDRLEGLTDLSRPTVHRWRRSDAWQMAVFSRVFWKRYDAKWGR